MAKIKTLYAITRATHLIGLFYGYSTDDAIKTLFLLAGVEIYPVYDFYRDAYGLYLKTSMVSHKYTTVSNNSLGLYYQLYKRFNKTHVSI